MKGEGWGNKPRKRVMSHQNEGEESGEEINGTEAINQTLWCGTIRNHNAIGTEKGGRRSTNRKGGRSNAIKNGEKQKKRIDHEKRDFNVFSHNPLLHVLMYILCCKFRIVVQRQIVEQQHRHISHQKIRVEPSRVEWVKQRLWWHRHRLVD